MTISANTSFFFKPEQAANTELMQKVVEIILDVSPFIEAEHQNEAGKSIYLGDINYDDHSEILDKLKDEKIEAECSISDCTDTSIEDFTTKLINVDGEMLLSTLTKSGERVVEELKLCLEQIQNGADMQQLTAFIEEKIKSIC